MADQTAVVIAALSIAVNVLVVPLTLWLAAPGIKIRFFRWQMRGGRRDASIYVNKNNNVQLLISKREGSKVKIGNGLYASTPNPSLIYRFFGIPLRIRRENDPEDIDIWDRENSTGLTAKELDNIVNEAVSEGLMQWLKVYFPVFLVAVGALVVLAIGSLYFQYVNFETLKSIAPDVAKLIPDTLRP